MTFHCSDNYGAMLQAYALKTYLRRNNYQADLIIIEGVEKVGLGLAIMNRLIRTSNFNYKEL